MCTAACARLPVSLPRRSLTYNVVGHLKTVLIVGGGVLLFGDSMGLKKLIGLGIAMSGIVWYSHIKMADAAKAPGKQ